ncbi:MAG: OmpA family protein, partial [Candidatus Binatia bacterium]
MKKLFVTVWLVLWAFFSPSAGWAEWDEYDESQSHPLRAIAYLLHPVGVIAEWTIARPGHFLVSTPGLSYLFGHRPHPPLFAEPQPAYDFGVPKRVPYQQPIAKKLAPQEPASEKVIVKEVIKEVIVEKPVIKEVIKEVPQIVEVEKAVFSDIAFRFNSADLTEVGKGRAYQLAERLKEKTDVVVVIEGHTDYIGSEEYNMQLGLRRAEAD